MLILNDIDKVLNHLEYYFPILSKVYSKNNAESDLKSKKIISLEALKILDKVEAKSTESTQYVVLESIDNAQLALKFTKDSQLQALKELGKGDAELALKFIDANQFIALQALGKDNAEVALKFVSDERMSLLQGLVEAKDSYSLTQSDPSNFTSIGRNYCLDLGFITDALLSDLEMLGKVASKFITCSKLRALEILRKDNAELALEFTDDSRRCCTNTNLTANFSIIC